MKDLAEIKSVCLEFREGIVGASGSTDRCFMVCAPLSTYLKFAYGIQNNLIEGYFLDCHHFWIHIAGTDIIIDPTQDQFQDLTKEKLEKVYIGPLTKNYELT